MIFKTIKKIYSSRATIPLILCTGERGGRGGGGGWRQQHGRRQDHRLPLRQHQAGI
jgi:hypothetical protein